MIKVKLEILRGYKYPEPPKPCDIALSRVPSEGEYVCLTIGEDEESLVVKTVFHIANPKKGGAVALIRVA